MARKERKFHYIYKITCIVTNKFYVGMHSTDNLNDGYMGSGTRLGYSKRKHGVENHTKEILEFLSDRNSLKAREIEIITEDFIKDPFCMNLKPGGYGGFCNEEHKKTFIDSCIPVRSAALLKGRETQSKNWKSNPEWRAKRIEGRQLGRRRNNVNDKTFLGKTHTDDTKQLMREKAQQRVGDKNSQYGTFWITNGKDNKKIRLNEAIPEGWQKGRTIK